MCLRVSVLAYNTELISKTKNTTGTFEQQSFTSGERLTGFNTDVVGPDSVIEGASLGFAGQCEVEDCTHWDR